MTDIVERLKERAGVARSEGNMTARCDADYFDEAAALIASQAARIRELEAAASRLADRNCTYDTTGLFIPFDSHAQALAAMIDLRSLLSRKGGE